MSHPDSLARVGTRATISTSGRSFLSRAIRRSETEGSIRGEHDAPKGPLGLTTLYEPGNDAVLDLIFVHGLNGGSQSTWSKGGDANFWPREWLPQDEAFQDVRIHSFGYSSALNTQGSVLNVQDFANNLLAFVQHSPIASSDVPTPIIFVAHSMGGLVVKKAYIISRQNFEYEDIAKRVRGIFFLATPHQGAGIVQLLNRLLAVTPGSRPFVDDLSPQSNMLQSINEEFPRYSNDLQLFSFYETQSMYYGVGKGLIVEKHCAVMNYPNERRTYLDANHRDVARFSTPNDPSYCLVRSALATSVNAFRASLEPERQNVEQDDLAALIKFLGVTEAPEDDHMSHDSQRLPGSCQWLIERDSFQHWRDSMSSKTMWLRGRPGSGKSVMASHVINHLESLNFECSYFFFKNADKSKSSANAFLRSMALQMAASDAEILASLARTSNNWTEPPIDKFDHSPVWRKIFLSGMLKVHLNKPQYWVIDSLDECSDGQELMSFLSKAQDLWPLCIFITARAAADDYTNGPSRRMALISETIVEDNRSDISAFLTAHLKSLPGASIAAQQELANRVLKNSNGCFLWVTLVLRELRQVHTSAEINQVLDSNSAGMDTLYARVLHDMSRARYGKDLVKSILLWVTTAFRPLSTEELKYSIEKDINDSIDDVGKVISSLCGNLVYVGTSNKVQLVHLSAREYLTRKENQSEFAIHRPVAHKRLALVCLQALSGSRGGRTGLRRASKPLWSGGEVAPRNQTPLHDYASTYVFQHLLQVRSTDDEVFIELAKFLGSSEFLSWIEKLAATSDLQRIYQAGKYCLTMVSRRGQHSPPIGIQKQVDFVKRWGNDLMRLVNKFGRQLSQSPRVIHHLIPPFCPPESALRKQFGTSYRGFSVHGTSGQDWDDCLSTISYSRSSKPTEIESSQQYVAVALSNGSVIVYQNDTLVEIQALNHGEPIWSMAFGEIQGLFATGGAKRVKVWDLKTSTQLIELPASALCMALTFLNDDSSLWMALKNNTVLVYDLMTQSLQDEIDWSRDFGEQEASLRLKRPTLAKFSPQQRLLAIVYRGENILLWDINEECLIDIYSKDLGSVRNGESASGQGSTTVWSMAFVSTIEDNLLVASYSDGDVVMFSTDTGEICGCIEGINALTVACSPDGRTLATADSQGTIQLFDLRTRKCLYRLSFNTVALRTKRLTFTADNLRLLDIRGNQLRAWDPTVLLRQEYEDENSDTVSVTTIPQGADYNLGDQISITCMTCVRRTPEVFCGKADGSIHVYDVSEEPRDRKLFIQAPNCAIAMIYFDEDAGIVTCCDIASRITSRQLHRKKNGTYDVGDIIIDVKIDSTVSQVLCSGKHNRLLVSTDRHDTLWSLSTGEDKGQIAQIKGTPRPSWLSLPSNGEVLIHIESDTAHFYKWSTLEKVRSIRLSTRDDTPLLMSSILTFQHQQYFATVHNSESSPDQQSSYHLWDLRDFSYKEITEFGEQPATTVVFPQFHLSSSETKIEALVGVSHERAVFLGTNHWIYSADIINSAGLNIHGAPESSTINNSSVTRHFFFPDDWSSSINRVLIDIRRTGEIIFVKSAELTIIRRGLEVTENGIFNPNRGLPIQQSIARRPADKRHLSV